MFTQKLGLSLIACSLSFMVSFSAFGDDLDIYVGSSDSMVTYKPNVLFIMDTSGSMGSRDSVGVTRMKRVQDALRVVLGGATNINAGLMHFQNEGGPILFPVRDIDSSIAPQIILSIIDGQDDARQIGQTVTDGATINAIAQGTETIYSGFRYQNVKIPRSAIITSAFLRFTSARIDNSATAFIIKGEAVGNAVEFSTGLNNISDRPTSDEEIIWNEGNQFPSDGETLRTPDLTPIIQEIVNRSDWCGNNNLALIVKTLDPTAGANRQIYTSEHADSSAAELVITFDENTATGCTRDSLVYQVQKQSDNAEERHNGKANTGDELSFHSNSNAYTAVLFNDLKVPAGSTITNAYLEFTAFQNRNGSNARMAIHGAALDNPVNFSTHSDYRLKKTPKTSASVSWTNIQRFEKNGVYQSPSVSINH